jgi:hypothetical protein
LAGTVSRTSRLQYLVLEPDHALRAGMLVAFGTDCRREFTASATR